MLLSMLECVQSIDRLSALLVRRGKKKKKKEKKNDLCWNVAYGSDNFTPDGALETSIVQGKTQMAVQSLAMTELQTREWDKACWKWQQRGPHSLRVSTREGRRATYARRRQAEKKQNSFNGWWQHQRKQKQRNSALPLHNGNIRHCKCIHEASLSMFHDATPMITQMEKRGREVGSLSFPNISINLTYFNIFPASVHTLSPQDEWSRRASRQTDELKPKEYIFLPRLMNWRSVNESEIKSVFAYRA